MKYEVRVVDDSNREEVLKLKVAKHQQAYIETVSECLRDAKRNDNFIPCGLYLDHDVVGIVMYGFFKDEGEQGRLWLDRFLIDSKYQGKGYASIFMELVLDKLRIEYDVSEIFLSIEKGNNVASELYQKFGFEFNGELDPKGELIMVKKLKNKEHTYELKKETFRFKR